MTADDALGRVDAELEAWERGGDAFGWQDYAWWRPVETSESSIEDEVIRLPRIPPPRIPQPQPRRKVEPKRGWLARLRRRGE